MYTKKECLREHKYSIKSGAIKYISLFVVFLLSIYINFILIQLYCDIYRGIKDEFFLYVSELKNMYIYDRWVRQWLRLDGMQIAPH